ncbi:DUF4124 domain-containing protein [Agaribacter flavus]|uniref:DUF4124 domain-containing protein n=1 Tax=Agaribacter flavus TaxID=1902781 RepID=A0ABV7FVR9_9ALTE
MLPRVLSFMCLCLFASLANAKIYKIVNADGSITYSDKPIPGAIEVKLKSNATTIPAQTIHPIQEKPSIKKKSYRLSVSKPSDGATIRNNLGKVSITASLEPQISGMYNLLMGDKTYRSPTGQFQLDNVDRGEHSYQITFTDNTGKVIASTSPRVLYLHRTSIINRPN